MDSSSEHSEKEAHHLQLDENDVDIAAFASGLKDARLDPQQAARLRFVEDTCVEMCSYKTIDERLTGTLCLLCVVSAEIIWSLVAKHIFGQSCICEQIHLPVCLCSEI